MPNTNQPVAEPEMLIRHKIAPGESGPDPALQELVIRPRRGWIGIDWKELYQSREILYFFVWRDIKVRYKQTVLGMAWGVLQPLMMMTIFTVIFGRFAKVPSEGFPYPIFVFAGLLPWLLFSNGLAQGGLSLINQQRMLSKVYLPRLFIPTSAVGVFVVDMAASFLIYAVLMFWYGTMPSWQVIFVPFFVLQALLVTVGASCLLSALTIQYRDFRYIVPFLIQILMYMSPVIYPASMLPKRLSGDPGV